MGEMEFVRRQLVTVMLKGVMCSWLQSVQTHPDANHGAGICTPTKLRHKNGVNIGVHIPAPWSIWVRDSFQKIEKGFKLNQRHFRPKK